MTTSRTIRVQSNASGQRSGLLTHSQHAALLALPFIIASCAGTNAPRQPGVSKKEAAILGKGYYFGEGFRYPSAAEISDHQISEAIRKSADTSLDGEYAEAHSSRLVLLLAASGDERFAKLLSLEESSTRAATGRYVSSLWDFYGLHYPVTEHVLAVAKCECPSKVEHQKTTPP